MKTGKIVLASVLIWVFGILFYMLTCGWLFSWAYTFPPMIWKAQGEMNLLASNIVGLLGSFIFVLVYTLLYRGIPGKGIIKGLFYGFLVWLIGPLSGIVGMPFYMTISPVVVVYWVIQMLIGNLIKGVIVGAIYKGKSEKK